MRVHVLAFVACAGCFGGMDETFPVCTVLDEQPVADDDASLGFTVTDMVGALDGRTWAIAWLDGTEDDDPADVAAAEASGDPDLLFTDAALAAVRSSLTRTTMPASIRVSEDAEVGGGCPTAGTFLVAPVDLRLRDEAGTFVATAPGYVAASALDDASILVDTDDSWLELEAVPADLADAATDAAMDQQPTTTSHEVKASLDGTGEALDLFFAVDGEGPDANFMLSLARGVLTPR